MTDDLVKRLRAECVIGDSFRDIGRLTPDQALRYEAADEIERLRRVIGAALEDLEDNDEGGCWRILSHEVHMHGSADDR